MKKLLLFITVLFFGISTINAQDASYGYEAGDWLLGGGVTFGSMDMGGVETKMNTIAPQAGYFLNEKSAIGVSLGLMSTDVDGTKVSNTDFELAPTPLDLAEITDHNQVEPINYPFSISQRRLFLAGLPYALYFEFVISVVRRDL